MLNGQENGAMGRGRHWVLAYRIAEEWEQGEASHQLLHCFIQVGPPLWSSSLLRSSPPLLQSKQTEVKVSVHGPRGRVHFSD